MLEMRVPKIEEIQGTRCGCSLTEKLERESCANLDRSHAVRTRNLACRGGDTDRASRIEVDHIENVGSFTAQLKGHAMTERKVAQ